MRKEGDKCDEAVLGCICSRRIIVELKYSCKDDNDGKVRDVIRQIRARIRCEWVPKGIGDVWRASISEERVDDCGVDSTQHRLHLKEDLVKNRDIDEWSE